MGISITELSVIFIVVLLLFGPEQLPQMARQVGRVLGELRKLSDGVRRELYNSVYTPADEVRRELGTDLRSLKALKAELFSPPPGAAPALDPRRAHPPVPPQTPQGDSAAESSATASQDSTPPASTTQQPKAGGPQ
jgi:Tat protein translocase TatB subunit